MLDEVFLELATELAFWVSIAVVAAIARQPKVSAALLGLVLPLVALVDHFTPGGLSMWIWISAFITASLSLAAVIIAVLLRRAGDQSGTMGGLPLGREVQYFEADKLGLLFTGIALAIALALCASVAIRPPRDLAVIRYPAFIAILPLAFAVYRFATLFVDRDIVLLINDAGIIVRRNNLTELLPWATLAGYHFSFGIFTLVGRNGQPILRVDSTIDGFLSLLYHVNRHTFNRA